MPTGSPPPDPRRGLGVVLLVAVPVACCALVPLLAAGIGVAVLGRLGAAVALVALAVAGAVMLAHRRPADTDASCCPPVPANGRGGGAGPPPPRCLPLALRGLPPPRPAGRPARRPPGPPGPDRGG